VDSDGNVYGAESANHRIQAIVSLLPLPEEVTEDLALVVVELNLDRGIENNLDSKLGAAVAALDDLNENNDIAAVNLLGAFMNAVEAQRGKKITERDANILIAKAEQILLVILSQ
jgi:hypothetical protein